ncbi:hypothetical protein B0A49_00963 [Cryomyces minteri]|uniref:Uncharacterized protein n=1 Tax=Cryomyces minteri TaxID=331657 RepID=A0A4U0XT10_9PEZI|nr:hypothetical protein B0A49_00963 [Cryomyces minteri]
MANIQCRTGKITPGSRVTQIHLRIRVSASGERRYFFTTSGDPAGLEEIRETTGLSIDLLESAKLAAAADQRKSSISDGSGFVARAEALASGAGSSAPKRAAEDDMTPEEIKRQHSLRRDAYLARINAVPVTFKAQHDPAGEEMIKASAARRALKEGLVDKGLVDKELSEDKTLHSSSSIATATQVVQASTHSSKPSDEEKTLGTKNVSKVEVIGLETPPRTSSQSESRPIENATSEDAPERGFTRIGDKVLARWSGDGQYYVGKICRVPNQRDPLDSDPTRPVRFDNGYCWSNRVFEEVDVNDIKKPLDLFRRPRTTPAGFLVEPDYPAAGDVVLARRKTHDIPDFLSARIGIDYPPDSDGIRTYLVQFIDDNRKEILTTKDMWDMYDDSPHRLSIHGMQLWPGCKDPDAAPRRSSDKFGPAGLIG